MEKTEKDAIKGSLGEIDRQLENASDALQTIEGAVLYNQASKEEREEAEEMLEYYIGHAYELVSLALEVAGLDDTRTRLLEKLKEFRDKPNGLTAIDVVRGEVVDSKPLSYLQTIVQGMRGSIGEGLSTKEAFGLSKLEMILEKTAYLVQKRGISPKSEKDVQDVMDDYLGAFFSDYSKGFSIPKGIKNFKPDGGVPSLNAAIEFKFADSEQEVKQELGQIYEDKGGYSGSKDWTRFYTVLYQTQHFVSEDAFKAAVFAGGRVNWTPIIKAATGARKPKKAKALKAPPPKKKPAKKKP
jgi:hypothetical protein